MVAERVRVTARLKLDKGGEEDRKRGKKGYLGCESTDAITSWTCGMFSMTFQTPFLIFHPVQKRQYERRWIRRTKRKKKLGSIRKYRDSRRRRVRLSNRRGHSRNTDMCIFGDMQTKANRPS